ncbi:hypothetical protein [Methylobrevis albus]|uniref:Uncharacterized protein n=1 Tax=Methylobrevis albus TaxID=2793297 RepID=A0A931I1G8_9HYPH|nr:hypothetical protein [Methylobrevis albus]MBH0237664.1 hypothetical protein [Methylobrevis albus]
MLPKFAVSKTVLSAVAAVAFAAAALVSASAPAAADGINVRVAIGAPFIAGPSAKAPVVTVDHRGWDAHRPYYQDRGRDHGRDWHRGRDHRNSWRNDWRPQRVVKVCEPTWVVRKVEDRHGRVIKVVRTRTETCRNVYR